MTRTELLVFLRDTKLAVCASSHADGGPQAAVVGVAVSDALELIFDTVTTSRKHANLRRDGRCALVWWRGEVTVQLEGVADEPTGSELEPLRACYLAAFPDGHERAAWPDVAYVRVRPAWIRVSDFGASPPRIEELAP
ncbi:MAG: pyridoxamine 5'-phosphate oxidase family protein [Kofleriaceae bacterium]